MVTPRVHPQSTGGVRPRRPPVEARPLQHARRPLAAAWPGPRARRSSAATRPPISTDLATSTFPSPLQQRRPLLPAPGMALSHHHSMDGE
ncbi:hypothetical protein BDA96_09G090000 [Sorghum bicolor]|uniref:Uncharacterized protein n=1 Tax=Sorghum bicolor TaxID=4558 RepID=A0A921Q930_SORBI|nr:hypothetical protein BDA96_09G090000 [Sorghum bicolor]